MFVNKGVAMLLALTFIMACPSLGQKSKTQLQKEKKENLAKIAEAEKILSETKGKKQNSLGQLSALNQQIKAQESLINSIRNEVFLLSDEIDETNEIIASLSDDLENLKAEYSAMVYSAYKSNKGVNRLMFLFSAKTFNQFFMRLKYMEQYSKVRMRQAEQITKVKQILSDQVTVIQSKVSEKNILLGENLQESKNLDGLKKRQNKLFSNLQKQENQLRKDLENRKKAVAKLDKLINDIIKVEIEKAKLAERSSIDASAKLSDQFAENKTKLPWPVSGFISQKFGRHNHPVLKGIIMNSTGINIQTKQNEKVQSIFGGEVRTVAFVPLVGNTVLISHGAYFTVYAGLKDVFVKTGQKVNVGEELGTILTNKDGVSELKFEVRKSAKALDPQQWLTRK